MNKLHFFSPNAGIRENKIHEANKMYFKWKYTLVQSQIHLCSSEMINLIRFLMLELYGVMMEPVILYSARHYNTQKNEDNGWQYIVLCIIVALRESIGHTNNPSPQLSAPQRYTLTICPPSSLNANSHS